jgi:hypothetical protein
MSPLINGKVTSFQAYEDTAELVEAFRKKVTKRKDNCRDKHSTGATKRRFGCMAMAKKLARMRSVTA